MRVYREAVVGGTGGVLLFLVTSAAALRLTGVGYQVYGVLAAFGLSGMFTVTLALVTHLAGKPAAYAPIEGEAGAWGLTEMDAIEEARLEREPWRR